MRTNTVVYGPIDSPSIQRLLANKKRVGWRVLVLDQDEFKGEIENVKAVLVDEAHLPIAEVYKTHERQRKERLTVELGRPATDKEIADRGIIEYEIGVVEFESAEKPPVEIDIEGDIEERQAQNERLAKGFPPSKEDQARLTKAHAKRNAGKKL